ncbi:cysteine proteinase [Thelephora ganbajun]|uniref:Cysteine proteinase n=1 Tax=Thelephora ganbajun TaxID=370292 RepID=A0ACB6ZHR6_THEGA|nr:cysteine proteinase [Thelephora ganbajun]
MDSKTEEIVSVLDREFYLNCSRYDTTHSLSHPPDEAFAAKHMLDLGHDVKEFQVFHWKLHWRGWKKLEKKLTSPEFDCGGHKWRILLFPFGNPNAPPSDVVSIYLDSADAEEMEEGWHVCAQFALVISNPQDPTIYTVNHANHRFTAEESDWGFNFTRFNELRKLFQPQPDRNHPTIEGDSVVVSVCVRVLEDPTGVMWRTVVKSNLEKKTGYVGLKNQGATCYMNSLLQSLFHTCSFRKAVYQIPTEDEDPTESTSLALQRVFYRLQTSDKPVDTTELTKSFGWTSYDLSLQHDVQEFNKVLQDKLESKMKGTRAEDAIAKLFVGEMKTFIKCVNVSYESTRIERFNDIQLNVKGIKTLYDSFRDHVAVEMLDGESKYQAEGFGLQDARKRVVFQSLPPVLHLQLKRYGHGMQCDTMVKINDRFEFPFEIDLDEFLDETADRSKPWKYKLHGVLVHSGELNGGHYFALIKPDRDTRWLKFNDDRVTPVTDREVLEESYGGEPLGGVIHQTQKNRVRATKGSTNAYMLVYIRETAIDEVLRPLAEEDTPPHLGRRSNQGCIRKVEVRKREREEQHMTVKVITDETFSLHQGFDLAVFDERDGSLSDLQTFRVLRKETYSVFKSKVAQHFGCPESQTRLWVLVNRQNGTVRPDSYISENEHPLTVEAIRNGIATQQQSDLLLYLDILPDSSRRIRSDDTKRIMIFLKHFDTTRQSLFGLGKVHMPRVGKVRDLIPIINERMKWIPGTPLKLYEEVKPGMIEPMKLKYTFARSEIQNGGVICFQLETSDQEAQNLESQGLYSNPLQLYEFLRNQVMEPDGRQGSPAKPGSPREIQNVVSGNWNTRDRRNPTITLTITESADLDQPDAREGSLLGIGSLRMVSDVGAQQQKHGRILPPTASSQVPRNPEPEIERHVNEMDDVGSPTFPVFQA